jgi:hypothetical protein
MSKINLKDVKIEMTKDFNGNPNDVEVVECYLIHFVMLN